MPIRSKLEVNWPQPRFPCCLLIQFQLKPRKSTTIFLPTVSFRVCCRYSLYIPRDKQKSSIQLCHEHKDRSLHPFRKISKQRYITPKHSALTPHTINNRGRKQFQKVPKLCWKTSWYRKEQNSVLLEQSQGKKWIFEQERPPCSAGGGNSKQTGHYQISNAFMNNPQIDATTLT